LNVPKNEKELNDYSDETNEFKIKLQNSTLTREEEVAYLNKYKIKTDQNS
jgi:hypothetical protein